MARRGRPSIISYLLPFDVFANAYVDTGILILRPKQPDPDHTVATFSFPKQEKVTTLQSLAYSSVPQAVWSHRNIPLILDPLKLNLIQGLESKGTRLALGEMTTSVRGILTKGDEDVSNRKMGPDWLPFFDGDFFRYAIEEADKFVLFGDNLREKPSSAEVFFGKRLLIRRLVNRRDRLMCVVAKSPFVVKKDIYVFKGSDTNVNLHYLLALLNSQLLSFIYLVKDVATTKDDFRQITLAGLRSLSIRRVAFTTPEEERAWLLGEARGLYEAGDCDALLGFVEARLAAEPEQADVIHDLLAYLAERMVVLHEQRQTVERALDPFKFLSRGVRFVTLTEAFAAALKYGERLPAPNDALDIDSAHHDIDGLQLVPERDQWRLEVRCKLRDPDDGWQSWQYEEDGRLIARVWVPVYQLPLDKAQGRYYQVAFRVLDEFVHAKSFPGGRTRTTRKKLQLTRVPAFEEDVDLALWAELSAELTKAREGIASTDRLIDQIVYRLYALTEEEIAVVEGKAE